MDSLQEQVARLSNQVDALHEVIERLSGQLALMMQSSHSHNHPIVPQESDRHLSELSFDNHFEQFQDDLISEDILNEQQDLLIDDSYVEGMYDNRPRERFLGPELQIQRLTAQLTAAYNRIASLEEQLLSQRVH
jgi:hypothetical protein